jgi:hypothetical protein
MADNTATQRDPDVVSYEAFSGVRNDVDPERFGRADLAIGENVVLDKTGRVSRRGGQTQLNAAATHSLWSDREQLAFCVQGTSLKRIGTDYSLTTLRTVTANAYMHYVKVNDNVYFSNGIDTGVFDNGATRTWGLTVPPLPVVAVGVGNMPAGRYQFVSTYVRADGQESGARMAGQITVPDNSSLIFTLVAPTGLRTVIYHNVYITTPNGELLYLALTVPVASTTAVYANDTTELNYDLKTQFLGPPPAGQLVGYYSGRMLVAVEDRIHYSEPLAYELFDLRRYIPLNGRVTLVAQMEDKETLDQPGQNSGLFLGTDRSCGILIGSDPDSFPVRAEDRLRRHRRRARLHRRARSSRTAPRVRVACRCGSRRRGVRRHAGHGDPQPHPQSLFIHGERPRGRAVRARGPIASLPSATSKGDRP